MTQVDDIEAVITAVEGVAHPELGGSTLDLGPPEDAVTVDGDGNVTLKVQSSAEIRPVAGAIEGRVRAALAGLAGQVQFAWMPTPEELEEALKDVVDPELGVNVVDLGLVYGIAIDGREVTLDMTLTTAACPLQEMIEDQAQAALADLTDEVYFNWVWMPPWGPEHITEDGREQLRALGFSV